MEWFNWVEQALRNYAQFNGRSRRKEYWYFMLFYYCVVFAFSLLSVLTFGWILLQLFLMAMLIPNLAVTVRRLHDVGLSGKWVAAAFIIAVIAGTAGTYSTLYWAKFVTPAAFGLLFLISLFPGSKAENTYGPVP